MNQLRHCRISARLIWVVAVLGLAGSPAAAAAHARTAIDSQQGSTHARGTQPIAHVERVAKRISLRRECRRARLDVSECVEQLRAAKSATARYVDPAFALADGYIPVTPCEGSEAGAMGEHWVRVDLILDQAVDPREPEMLLYLNAPTGRRLIGAEWSMNAVERGLPHYGTSAPDPAHTPPAPTMFGSLSCG